MSLVKELSMEEAVQSDPLVLTKRWKSIVNKYVCYLYGALLVVTSNGWVVGDCGR